MLHRKNNTTIIAIIHHKTFSKYLNDKGLENAEYLHVPAPIAL
jgi:hypothetical protein